MKLVEIENLNKIYPGKKKDVHVLRSINLSIDQGEFIVLVGPSGCGKTTLLRTIAGLECASSGAIRIAGREVTDVEPAERDLAMVFQDYALYPHMNVRENLAFGLKQKKTSKDVVVARLENAANILGLTPLMERKPAELSGGQRQRVAIGRALVKEPKVFLFDEPLSNLDAQLRSQTRIELAALHRRLGSTSIYVTHDQVEAMTLADRIVVLAQGRIQQVGSPLDLYDHPANTFVASFIGSPGMNFLKGQLTRQGEEAAFKSSGVTLKMKANVVPTDENGEVVLGIRPEHMTLGPEGGVSGRIVQVEPHGHETHVLVELAPEVLWTVRVPGTARLKRDQNVQVDLDQRHLHWFNADGVDQSSSYGERLQVR